MTFIDNILYFIFAFVFAISSFPLSAQTDDIVFERLNTSHGLSNNTVKRIFQDSKGYLWIGTNDGLNKYDGYNFTNYRHDPDDQQGLGPPVVGPAPAADMTGSAERHRLSLEFVGQL